MASPIFISNPPPGFSVLAIIRGIQLAFLGIYRSWQQKYYERAFEAVKWSIIIHIVTSIPIISITIFLRFCSLLIISKETADSIIAGLNYYQYQILNISPFILMSFSYITSKLDDQFYDSLKFCDEVYKKKHPDSKREFYKPLISSKFSKANLQSPSRRFKILSWFLDSIDRLTARFSQRDNIKDAEDFAMQFLIQTIRSTGIFILSKTPYVGSLVVPIISFQQLNDVIGTPYAILVFIATFMVKESTGFFLLNTIFASKTLTFALLKPYMKKLPFTPQQQQRWYRSRIGILYGFGLIFYLLLKIPYIGIVVLGLAETSTAHLITKITDPPLEGSDSHDINALSDWLDQECIYNASYYNEIQSMVTGASEEHTEPLIPGTFD